MKHLFLQDHNSQLMVYYRSKDKVRLFEKLVEIGVEWDKEEPKMSIIEFTKFILNANGFKVLDISDEIKETLNLRVDFNANYFTYKGVRVYMNSYGLTFRNKTTTTTCKTIEEALRLIDNGN